MMRHWFDCFARKASQWAGNPWAFMVAVMVVVVWAALGPALGYSEQWQLFINTGTTIVTFLLVFLIQTSQNRDTTAIQAKLDELIKVDKKADDSLIAVEKRSDGAG